MIKKNFCVLQHVGVDDGVSLGVWKSAKARSFMFYMFHLTSEEEARAESRNFLLVNPSDDVQSKTHRIKECVIACINLRPKQKSQSGVSSVEISRITYRDSEESML